MKAVEAQILLTFPYQKYRYMSERAKSKRVLKHFNLRPKNQLFTKLPLTLHSVSRKRRQRTRCKIRLGTKQVFVLNEMSSNSVATCKQKTRIKTRWSPVSMNNWVRSHCRRKVLSPDIACAKITHTHTLTTFCLSNLSPSEKFCLLNWFLFVAPQPQVIITSITFKYSLWHTNFTI